jgi:hypothetical protein
MIIESYEDVIVLSGALRANFWETVHTAISLVLKRSPDGVIIDCSNITECTIAGADTFADIQRFTERHDARVIVAAVPKAVMDVLRQVPDVRSQLPIAESVEAARKSLHVMGTEEEESSAKKRRRAQIERRFLVGLMGSGGDPMALQVACEHATAMYAELVLVAPIVVPRDLPLQAPLEEEEDDAQKKLESARAYCEEHQVMCSREIGRGRDLAGILEQAVVDTRSSQVIVPLSHSEEDQDSPSKVVKAVLGKISVPILFVADKKV